MALALEGTTLGAFRILRILGSGLVGDVYLAEPLDPTGQRIPASVALKVLPGNARAASARAMLDQISILIRERRPQMLPIYEVGEAADLLYVAMAYRPSGSLEASYRRARGASNAVSPTVPPRTVADLIASAAEAISAAHLAGVVHGDIKPDNVFIAADNQGQPTLEVADFGQASFIEAALARVGWGAMESLLYAAPEQIAGETVSASDQYGLAGLAYLLLTGHPPHGISRHLSSRDSRHALLPNTPDPAHLHNASLGSDVDLVLARALAREPTERFPSARIFAESLRAAVASGDSPISTFGIPQPTSTTMRATPMAPMLAVPEPSDTEKHAAVGKVATLNPVHVAGAEGTAYESVSVKPVTDDTAAVARKGSLLAAFRHFVSYVLVGVASTVVNLICFQALYAYAGLPYSEHVRYLIGYLGAAEVATMFNFILNDRFTFSGYDGRQRPWIVRCLRFHSTVINGFILTFIVSGILHYAIGVTALISQAAGIFVAFVVNYVLHHVWTYRSRKQPTSAVQRTVA